MHRLPASTSQPFLFLRAQVLRFWSYFTEAVENSALEKVRVRRMEIRFYLEDNLVEIHEPKEPNSGLPSGIFLHKHR
jgi:hypothetical protein